MKDVTISEAEVLRGKMVADHAYDQAMRAFLSTPPTAGTGAKALPSRDELYDRAGLRR